MKADLIIHHIRNLYTPYKKPPVKGILMREINVIHDAYLCIKGDKILMMGSGDYSQYVSDSTVFYDAKHKIMLPGLIDSHTHLVHGGSRESEYAQLLSGVSYLDILNSGGGIHKTVEHTTLASEHELYDKAYHSLDHMLKQGVCLVEGKSGYGLSLETEVKQLITLRRLNENHEIEVIPTYMGAHAIPKRYKDNRSAYVDEVIRDLKKIKEHDLAVACDVFCEDHVFSVDDTRKILLAAKALGLEIKMHADEITSLGGVALAVELGCTSVDHLMVTTEGDMELLAKSNTVANLLPGTSFYLNKPFAKGRQMIDKGVAVSISTDYNPGSCPTENLQLVMQIVANKMRLLPEEILTAVTINPAYHLGKDLTYGSIEPGKLANVILMDAPNLNYVFYHFGVNHTTDVWIKGKHVVENGRIRREV